MFYMEIKYQNGKQKRIRLDTAEKINFITYCAICRAEIKIPEKDYRKIAIESDFYSAWFCSDNCVNTFRADPDSKNQKIVDFKLKKEI